MTHLWTITRSALLALALIVPAFGAGGVHAEIAQLNLSVSNDYTNEKWVDLDADGRGDVKLELIRLEKQTLMGQHSVEIRLRASTSMTAAVAGGPPLEREDEISNFLNFGRSANLIYYGRQMDTERHGGDWFTDLETRSAYLPVRLRVAQGIRLGWLEIEFDGYGSARILRYGLSKDPGATCLAGSLGPGPAAGRDSDCAGDCKTSGKSMRLALK